MLRDASEVAAIGFKAVHARNLTGVHMVDEAVLAAMEAFADVAPAHNPPYTKAMRMLRDRFPQLPLVAAFETGFHRTIPEANQRYAIPDDWATELGIRRWGFHGASHRYIAGRMAELLGRSDIKVISCHLGGSSSLCAIRNGQSVACSLGMSPQSGLAAQQPRGRLRRLRPAGDPARDRQDAWTKCSAILANQSGLEGVSGAGRDLRDIEAAADAGDARAELAIDVFIASIRHYLGAYLVELERGRRDRLHRRDRRELGADSHRRLPRPRLVRHRARPGAQRSPGRPSAAVSTAGSRVQVWTVPTNEEIVVARQSKQLLEATNAKVRRAMFLARVTGSVVATQKVASMTGHKLLTVEPYRVDDKERDRLVPTGRTFVVVDTLGAGIDEMVLICQGSSARLTPETEKLPIDAVVIGLVDTVDIGGRSIFSAHGSRHEPVQIRTWDGPHGRDSDSSIQRNGVRHANDRRHHPQRGPGSAGPDGQRGRAGQWQGPCAAVGQPGRVLDGRRRGLGRGRPAFQAFRTRPLEDRTQGGGLHPQDLRRPGRGARAARARGDQDRPARPQDRQAPRRDPAACRASSTSAPTTMSGDDGLTLTDYAPFGVIGAITPVTHSLPTLAGNAINMLAAGNTVVFNAHPSGHADRGRGRAAVQQGHPRGDRARKPADDHRPAHARVGQRRCSTTRACGCWSSPAGPAVARAALASKKRAIVAGPGQSAGRRRRDRLPRERRPLDRQPAAPSTTTCSASARSRSSPSPRSSTR